MLVCDDLSLVNTENNWNPSLGFNQFLTEMSGQYTLVHQDEQHTLIQKK
jgi:hypothetical protein